MSKPLFEMGRLVASRHALDLLSQEELHRFLTRHAAGDWGDCCESDKKENDFAPDKRLRILSIYHSEDGTKCYVITEADRSSTALILADEY